MKKLLIIMGLIVLAVILWRYGIIFIPLILPFGFFSWSLGKKKDQPNH